MGRELGLNPLRRYHGNTWFYFHAILKEKLRNFRARQLCYPISQQNLTVIGGFLFYK